MLSEQRVEDAVDELLLGCAGWRRRGGSASGGARLAVDGHELARADVQVDLDERRPRRVADGA